MCIMLAFVLRCMALFFLSLTVFFSCPFVFGFDLFQLEDFLVANRDEYLRHSAMNYTSQQRQYNNRLTERLLELAARHGYIFDEEDFDFVTVRDRIRCYYKSYVQSKRKKGIKVGYAPDRKKAKNDEGDAVAPTAGA